MKTAPKLSIIIPVYNGGSQLEQCLAAICASDFRDYEIVVVDDGSTDGSAELARAHGAKVLHLARRLGPAAARNRGAGRARADLILFIDADVVVRRDTLAHVAAFFRTCPGIAAAFGSYDDAPAARNFVSQYKNLLHHFVHQQSAAEAATFWAGCGAIRRKAFEDVGGFDERKYRRPSIEDIEMGHRLRRKGFRIILDKELQVKHLKRWTFSSLLRTDIFNRALPWSKLILEEDGMINDLNLRVRDRVSAALVWLAVSLLVLSYFSIAFFAGMLATLTAILLLNLPFYRFLKERRGRLFALRSFGMLSLYYFYSASVFALCYCMYVIGSACRFTRLKRRAAESEQVNDA
ncbi:MAG TPA: glycosyltransferase [Pyrinomonadaceae bacterium]|nr:glycosyltransferase [Pyrinomonadaceae bacterium]